MGGLEPLCDLLAGALVADPPVLARDGGLIAAGHDADLDAARRLRDEGRDIIAGLQGEYAEATGIASLKIKHNNVLGYFIETTATHARKMLSPPLSDRFRHRQTTANAVRFITEELADLQSRILNATGEAIAIEMAHFEGLRTAVLDRQDALFVLADALADLDVHAALAEVAVTLDWCRPTIDHSRVFEVTAGRHPVVEGALGRSGKPFVANDCDLSPREDGAPAITLLTGPNMAGKSTWLRQNALIAILAQMGAFVPARQARLGIVSQVFSRVGASDDLREDTRPSWSRWSRPPRS